MRTFISVDVATKSLAVGVYQLPPLDKGKVEDGDYICSMVNPLLMKVYDINSGAKVKDTTIHHKAVALKQTLTEVDDTICDWIADADVTVLIEYQMNANHLSNAIFNMILYHYAGRYPVEVIKPSWKNTIALHSTLTLSEFLAKASSNYKANKEHTRQNMLYLLEKIDRLDMIKCIKKSNQDDISDTLCQMIAYAIKN